MVLIPMLLLRTKLTIDKLHLVCKRNLGNLDYGKIEKKISKVKVIGFSTEISGSGSRQQSNYWSPIGLV